MFLELPIKAAETAAVTAFEENAPVVAPGLVKTNATLTKKTILIAEDHPELRTYLKEILSSQYSVIEATNGAIAWEILQDEKQKIDLLLSDLMMPQMDGLELLEKVKSNERYAWLPVILLTARSSAEVKLNALRIGVDDYLQKPFREEELQLRIRNILQYAHQRQAAISKSSSAADRPEYNQADQEWLQQIESFYRSKIKEPKMTVEWIAKEQHLSSRQLTRRLKKLTGLTPNQYLRELRLQMAKDFLYERKYKTVKEVSHAVGFKDTRHFSSLFKNRFGIAPSNFLS
jgi:DNA-binding response OmpR family regulator